MFVSDVLYKYNDDENRKKYIYIIIYVEIIKKFEIKNKYV